MGNTLKKLYFLTIVLILASLLSACGFHLRGQGVELTGAKVWLLSNKPDADFERSLKQRLSYQGATLVKSAELSEVQLAISDYNIERRTVARDSFGRASELELVFTLQYQLLTPAQAKTNQIKDAAPETKQLISRREFAYERNLQSGQDNEQQRLISDMHQDVITRLLLELAQARKQG